MVGKNFFKQVQNFFGTCDIVFSFIFYNEIRVLGAPVAPTPTLQDTLAIKPIPEVPMRNQLEQYCHYFQPDVIPVYETVYEENTYTASVVAMGIKFFGVPQRKRKEAEASAAENALLSLTKKKFKKNHTRPLSRRESKKN